MFIRQIDMSAVRNNDYANREPFQYRYFGSIPKQEALINNLGRLGTWQIRKLENGICAGNWWGKFATLDEAERALRQQWAA